MLKLSFCSLLICAIMARFARSDQVASEPTGESRSGALTPRESETRELRSLDGVWNFRLSPPDPQVGIANEWFKDDLAKTGLVINMPVPSSYNDITEDAAVRDHVGIVWYDRRFYAPDSWRRNKQLVWLRFGSVHYGANVWINGVAVMRHEIGHLPFEQEISTYLRYGESNLVTVACDNTILSDTVPQGQVTGSYLWEQEGLQQHYSFDFFNYAGIHRSVVLYTTPTVFIDDIIVNTDIEGDTGYIIFNVTHGGYLEPDQKVQFLAELIDKNDTVVAQMEGSDGGVLEVSNAHFWWPYLMDKEAGYLYTLQISLFVTDQLVDIYRLKVGIRTVSWSDISVFLNNKPIYMRGFGMHEDSDIRGKGLDLPLFVKNFNLIKWTGANTFRTSHYPYSEEQYDMADELGIMIIDECPSVNTDLFSLTLLNKHKDSLTQLIRRDKNHPSVIMWSIANEPKTQSAVSDKYFGEVADHVRSLDTSRAITVALSSSYTADRVGQHLDVISFNRYNGWYSSAGRLETITENVIEEARAWHKKFSKPVLMSEYGADTIEGLHLYPEYVWSEDYQVALMSEHFKAFDRLREEQFFVGEFIWNFADFKTAQTYTRVGGNKKGIFTRQRQPKAAAHHLRKRYHQLASITDEASLPKDLFYYTSSEKKARDEL